MEDFFEREAAVSSNDSDSDVVNSDDEVVRRKPKKKQKRRAKINDDDDEEDEEDDNRDIEGLIDDNPIEEEGDGESAGSDSDGGEKRKHDSEDDDEDLDDEDYALLEENLGTTVKRTHKRRRIKMASDDEEPMDREEERDDKELIENEIFDNDDEPAPSVRSMRINQDTQEFDLDDSGEESEEDVNDFIVDDEDRPIVDSRKKKKHRVHDDAALQEAYDIFGADIDFDDFAEYGEDEEEEEQDLEYEPDLEDEDGELHPRPVKVTKKKKAKTTIYQVFEPSELERSHFTDFDQEVRMADMPERFQLRDIPVCPTEDGELDEEADWIYRQAFSTPPLSKQDYFENEGGYGGQGKKGPSTIPKIKEALNLMRNQKFEVPFIAFYRKEHIDPELDISDLWKVYHWDEKWMQLKNRKQNLVRLLEQMQQYQFDQITPDKPLEASFRRLSEEDIDRLAICEDIDRVKMVQSVEELNDAHQHFMLYYCNDVSKMKAANKAKKRQQQGEDQQEEHDEEPDTLKHATRKSGYTVCVDAGLIDIARRFGLTPEQFGENLRDNYQRHEVEQDPAEPKELADEYIKGQFSSVDLVMQGARHIVAMQIAHDPVVRSCVRQTFYERAKINVRPTKKGLKEIDESHSCYAFKYLKSKPVQDLCDEQYLKIAQAEQDKLLTTEIFIDEKDTTRFHSYYEEIRQLYHRDEFSNLVQEWNRQRSMVVERALNKILYPLFVKEVKAKLLEEAKECIVKLSCRKLYNWLKVAPYQVDQPMEEEDEDFDTSRGMRIMGVGYAAGRDEASYCAIIDGDGEVTDYLRLPYLTKRKNSWNKEEREQKENELEKIRDFILTKKPHVIAVGAESRDILNLMDDLKNIVSELESEQQITPISVELVDNELAKVYANSKKADNEMREYPIMLRQAISLARRLQDPLVEFGQLCNADEDILCLRFHELQDSVNKDILLESLFLEFVNRVNEVGVDVSRCIGHPHTAALIQFICGLGPRKGYHLLKTLKQHNSRLENRTQLVTHTHVGMGPKVFINCAGFVKIDTTAVVDGTDTYVEVLDGSRIHPETYEWARKMAVDALEYDDTAEDANPAGALEEILESPERLKDLDLDAFAEELERQGYGDKHITLYDIRAELNHRYKDLRTPFRSATAEEKFNLLTKETPQTFYIGKLITCRVTGIAHRRPQGEQLEVANPVRNDETGLWQCPFCSKKDFPELSEVSESLRNNEVWNHFDAGGCPGQAVGVKTRLDNDVNGFIPMKNISDKHVTNPEERVKIGMVMHARISKIDIDRFQVELTSKTSDLVDKDHKWRLSYDPFYDTIAEEEDKQKEEDKNKNKAKQTYVKRVIAHPSFQNIDFATCEKIMEKGEQGDVIIRPSSKGSDHLTATWKVGDGCLSHIDIKEEGKVNPFSLGKSLSIENESFEDLDEIIARHITPMAAFARDIINYRYFKEFKDEKGEAREKIESAIMQEKRQFPSKIPYYFSMSRMYPGKFLLSYLPRKTTRHEYVSVTPDGLKYRGQIFHHLPALVKWFKEHFRDPIPGAMTAARTPMVGTPAPNMQHQSDMQRAGYGTMQPPLTPFGGGYGPYQAPIATPVMTPMLTPGQPHHMTQQRQPMPIQTPQYTLTPRPQWNSSNFPATPQTPVQSSQPVRPVHMGPSGGGGGDMEPRQAVNRPPPQSASSQDWAKAAQMWVKHKTTEQPPSTAAGRATPRRTPRPGQSPFVNGVGDATPLIDEH